MSTSQDAVQALSNATQAVDAQAGDFWSQLRPASFRGVPFWVSSGGSQMGRRNAVHEYPFRDTPWVEDLGKSARRFQVVGFIEGDDVIAQRDRMVTAVEAAGDGELVHPTYGRIQAAVIGFDVAESEWGRTFEYRFTFVRQGARMYPASTALGTALVSDAAQTLSAAGAAAFVTAAAPGLANSAAAISAAAQQATSWTGMATSVAQDATSLLKLSVTLPGQFGRLLGLASGIDLGQILPSVPGLTVADLTATAAVARQAVAQACQALTSAATHLGPNSIQPFTDAVQGVASAILAVASTPGDALRGLATMATFQPVGNADGDGLVVQGACADVFRRAALSSMAIAGSNYQPASSNDATAARNQVLDILDAQVDVAGDQFEDDVYSALKALRAQVVQDLNARGAQLPTLVTVSFGTELPSLVLAQRLYRDASRADELVTRANPIHPAFMPRQFEALNT